MGLPDGIGVSSNYDDSHEFRSFNGLMKVLIRADGGSLQGTGHIMRCLTLARELRVRGHEVELMTSELDVEWLAREVRAAGITVHPCRADDVPLAQILELRPTWVVLDSYRFDPALVAALNARIPVLAIIDGDDRQLEAELYLDQNLGAEFRRYPAPLGTRVMSGASFALIRNAVLIQRRSEPWRVRSARPVVVSFMGGTDPMGATICAARAFAQFGSSIDLTLIAPESQHPAILTLFDRRSMPRILGPTPNLPALLGPAEIVVSAAGTSAWDVCTLGIPTILVAVVDNQKNSLDQAVSRGLTLGIDAIGDVAVVERDLTQRVSLLMGDDEARRTLSETCLRTFDGKGTARVAARLESHRFLPAATT